MSAPDTTEPPTEPANSDDAALPVGTVETVDARFSDSDAMGATIDSRTGTTQDEDVRGKGLDPAPQLGRGGAPIVPGYAIDYCLGRGGMGEVWKAKELTTGRVVALKLLKPDRLSEGAMKRFELEVAVTAQLDHPNIARLYHSQVFDGALVYAMEYIDGFTLEDWDRAQDKRVPRRAAELMVDICRAVGHAHQRGIIHRDLKLANVMLTKDGAPKVVDFGLAKLVEEDATDMSTMTAEGAIVGTPAYMAPEQMLGDLVTTRSDVYALGVMAYRLALGRAPIDVDGKVLQFFKRVLNEYPRRPRTVVADFDPDLEAILLKALELKPDDRYGNAAALADDLQRYLDGLPVQARGTGTAYVLQKAILRHRGKVAAGIVTLLGLLTLGVFSYNLVLDERDAARAAEKEARQARQLAEARLETSRTFASDLIRNLPERVYRGPTSVRQQVVEAAAKRLGQLRKEAADSPRLALDYAVGLNEIAWTKRELTQAKVSMAFDRSPEQDLEEVLRLNERFGAKAKGDDAGRWKRVSQQARLRLVRFLHDAGKRDQALEAGNQLLTELRAEPKPDPEILGNTLLRMCWLWGAKKDWQRVREAIAEAERWLNKVSDPVMRTRYLADAEAQRGWSLKVGGKPAEGAKHYEKAVLLLDGLRDPDLLVVRQKAHFLASLAWTYESVDPDKALDAASRAIPLRDLEATADPANLRARREMGWARVRRAITFGRIGRLEEAAKDCEKAAAVFDTLDIGDMWLLRDRSAAYTVRAGALMDLGQLEAARIDADKAAAVLSLAPADARDSRLYLQAMATTESRRAHIAVLLGKDVPSRLDALGKALDAYAPSRNPKAAADARAVLELLRAQNAWYSKSPARALKHLRAADAAGPSASTQARITLLRADWSPPAAADKVRQSVAKVLEKMGPAPATPDLEEVVTRAHALRLVAEFAPEGPERVTRAREAAVFLATHPIPKAAWEYRLEAARVQGLLAREKGDALLRALKKDSPKNRALPPG